MRSISILIPYLFFVLSVRLTAMPKTRCQVFLDTAATYLPWAESEVGAYQLVQQLQDTAILLNNFDRFKDELSAEEAIGGVNKLVAEDFENRFLPVYYSDATAFDATDLPFLADAIESELGFRRDSCNENCETIEDSKISEKIRSLQSPPPFGWQKTMEKRILKIWDKKDNKDHIRPSFAKWVDKTLLLKVHIGNRNNESP